MSCKKCRPVIDHLLAKYPTLENSPDECFFEEVE